MFYFEVLFVKQNGIAFLKESFVPCVVIPQESFKISVEWQIMIHAKQKKPNIILMVMGSP